VSLIGTLEQVSLSLVLQGIETYRKTGLLVIKQDAQWVELYFRDGRLLCIGPVKANATLGERLLQAGVISQSALQDALLTIGDAQCGETRMALTLMELGHVSHEGLRAWATKEASNVLRVLLQWQKGSIFFEDGQPAPADRLLVALSCLSLLPLAMPMASTPQPQHTPLEIAQPMAQPQLPQAQQLATSSIYAAAPAYQRVSQLIAEPELPTTGSTSPITFSSSESSMPTINMFSGFDEQPVSTLTPPQRISTALPPLPVDTSYLRPDTVLLPVDLSSLRSENLQLPLTPERWRLLTRVDGRTTLQQACQELAMSAELLCQVAGELITLGLVQPMTAQQAAIQELSPISRELLMAGLGNGYITPGSAAFAPQPWVAITPTTEALPPAFHPSLPCETNSQWGNGANGATFVPGRGWIANPQPLQPLQPSGPLYLKGMYMYAPAGNGR